MPDIYSDKSILLFDGVCNLCNGVIQFVIKHDKKRQFRFAALQSDAGQALLKQLHLNQNEFDTIVLIEDGKHYVKSEAALRTARHLSGIWSAAYSLRIIPKAIRDWFYDRVAGSRYSIFGKKDSCMIPTPELKELFLD